MKRRGLLGSAGIVLASVVAGCLGDEDDPGESTNGDPETDGHNDNPENGSPNDFERHVSITDVDEVPEAASAEFDIRVTDSTVTADGTAFLEAVVTNTGDGKLEVKTPYYKGQARVIRASTSIRSKPPIVPRRTILPTASRIRAHPRSSSNGRMKAP